MALLGHGDSPSSIPLDKAILAYKSFSPLIVSLAILIFTSVFLLLLNLFRKKRNLPPGPKPLPMLGNLLLLGEIPFVSMAELAKKHGPIMTLWFGSNLNVVISSPELAKDVLRTQDSKLCSRPSTISSRIVTFDGITLGFNPYGDYWRRLRRLLTVNVLSQKRIQAWIPHQKRIVTEMCDAIAKESRLRAGTVNLRTHLLQAMVKFIMKITTGTDLVFSSFGEPATKDEEVLSLIRDIFDVLAAGNLADHVPILSLVDYGNIKSRSRALRDKVVAYLGSFFEARIEERKTRKSVKSEEDYDYVDVLLDQKGDEKLSRVEMVSLLQDLFLAGTDTSAVTTEWALAELLCHPDKVDRLHREVKDLDVGSHDSNLFSKLPYFQAVVKEAFRMHPVGPLLVPRMAMEDVKVAGYDVPKGTTIHVNVWAIAHDPNVWKSPDDFIPERFLEEEVDFRGQDFRFLPFGSGRRICPGLSLGHSNIEIMLASIVKRFSLSIDPDYPLDMTPSFSLAVGLMNPLTVKVVERD